MTGCLDVDGKELHVGDLVELVRGRPPRSGRTSRVVDMVHLRGNAPDTWNLQMASGTRWFNTSVRLISAAEPA